MRDKRLTARRETMRTAALEVCGEPVSLGFFHWPRGIRRE